MLDAHEGARWHVVEGGCPGSLMAIHNGKKTSKLAEFEFSIWFELCSIES
jgi:hypothetical protein